MLTLTITNPADLTEAERFAILTFCQIRLDRRNPEKIAGASEPRDSVRAVLREVATGKGEVIHLHGSTGDPTSRGEVRIDPLDDPSVGVLHVPPVPSAMPVATAAAQAPAVDTTRDYASLFGGTPAVPSVPVPLSPVVPAVPSAVSAPPAVSVPPAGGSDVPPAPANPTNALDSAGMPWDHRIHATTKGKNQDGTWRAKRGVDPKLVEDVQEQNKRLMAIAPPPVPPAVPGAPAPDTEGAMTFPDLMEQVIRLINNNKLTIESANAACLPIGVTFLHQLDKRPDLVGQAWSLLQRAAGVA